MSYFAKGKLHIFHCTSHLSRLFAERLIRETTVTKYTYILLPEKVTFDMLILIADKNELTHTHKMLLKDDFLLHLS